MNGISEENVKEKEIEETLKKEPIPDIRREYINGEWREVRHYSDDERFVPMSYARREAEKIIKEMLEGRKESFRRLEKQVFNTKLNAFLLREKCDSATTTAFRS